MKMRDFVRNKLIPQILIKLSQTMSLEDNEKPENS